MLLWAVGPVTPPRLPHVILGIASFLYDNDPENDVRLPSFLSSSAFFVRFCHAIYYMIAPHSLILDELQALCRLHYRQFVFLL